MRRPHQDVVLVVGDADDPHVQTVGNEIERCGRSTVVVSPWEPDPTLCVTFDGSSGEVTLMSRPLAISSSWFRAKPRSAAGLTEPEAFALRERRDFMAGLVMLACDETRMMNHPVSQERARNKIIQLTIAREVGLSTARTWITADPVPLLGAAESLGGGMVYKPLTWLATLDGQFLFTNLVSPDDLRDNREILQVAPGIFQEFVPKKREHRVTIVDDQVFSVAILSQERDDTVVDWRRNQGDVRYLADGLPLDVEMKLRDLMHRLGLRFGAIDLIESKSGEFVFLEVNPAGNWLWLEDKVGIPVSKAVAHALMS